MRKGRKTLSPAKRGRETKFTKELAARICERMATGESLRSVCRSPGFPPESTVRQWAIEDRDGFAAQYARAREAQMDALAEDILDIADEAKNDVTIGEDGRTNYEVVARAKLRVDTRKWLMSKIAPKRYGEKITHASDPDSPLKIEIVRFGDACGPAAK